LAVRYCGPFEVLERICHVAYMLAFSASRRVHIGFQVSLLNMYVPDPNHVVDWNMIQVEHEGDFQVKLVHILDQKFKALKNP
jgi:hypothetical protein